MLKKLRDEKCRKYGSWTLGVMEKVVCNNVLDMCTKILEFYDSHCSFSGLKSNFAYWLLWLDGRLIIPWLLKGIESLNIA